MSEMKQALNMIGTIRTTHIIRFPSGKWGYVGLVPEILAYVDPTPEQLKNTRFGARFGPKRRIFETEKEARDFAAQQHCEITD